MDDSYIRMCHEPETMVEIVVEINITCSQSCCENRLPPSLAPDVSPTLGVLLTSFAKLRKRLEPLGAATMPA